MRLNLGEAADIDALDCGCVVRKRKNGCDTIDPCVGHAVAEGARGVEKAIAKLERTVRLQSDAMERIADSVRPRIKRRRAGVVRRAWRFFFKGGLWRFLFARGI